MIRARAKHTSFVFNKILSAQKFLLLVKRMKNISHLRNWKARHWQSFLSCYLHTYFYFLIVSTFCWQHTLSVNWNDYCLFLCFPYFSDWNSLKKLLAINLSTVVEKWYKISYIFPWVRLYCTSHLVIYHRHLSKQKKNCKSLFKLLVWRCGIWNLFFFAIQHTEWLTHIHR